MFKSIVFKNKIRCRSNPSRNVTNLSKHSFSSDTYKLLIENLDFIPTPKIFSKKQPDADAENLFGLVKLWALFKDIKTKPNIDPVNQPFSNEKKRKIDTLAHM